MPRFSIKDLLLSMALVGFGLGAIVVALKLKSPWSSLGSYGLVLIGVGTVKLFNRPWIGAGIGCLSYLAVVFVLVAVYGRW